MTNGGGPSASLDVPTALGGLLPAEVRESYDLVAFDPRGIGYSTPMSCGRDADELVRDLPSACAIGALETYLTGGELPATDTNCG